MTVPDRQPLKDESFLLMTLGSCKRVIPADDVGQLHTSDFFTLDFVMLDLPCPKCSCIGGPVA